jgi:hypothetical protein
MIKDSTERMLGGTGTLIGPSQNAQFGMVVTFIKANLPIFVKSILKTEIDNENALNGRLSRFITNTAAYEFFFANSEHMEDETHGGSPAVDIGIYLKIDDTAIDPPMITVFEGKRLTTKLPKKRCREYVIGHEKSGKHIRCGGIERFKLSIHGSKLNHAGMIGYIQDGTSDDWQKKVNTWICELCNQHFNPAWTEHEQLKQKKSDGRVIEHSSVVNRVDSELHLTHLWVDLSL